MTENDDKGSKIYEVGYLLVPELSESAVAEEVGNLKSLILDTVGAAEIGSEMPKMIDLSYQMEKRVGSKKVFYTKAHFGWIKFELHSGKIADVKESLAKNNKIIRFLIIKTVRENTMVAKKVFVRQPEAAARKKPGIAGEQAPAMTEEEMDKTIEELVIE